MNKVTSKNYFDHEADMGVIGYGNTLEDAFVNIASATFAIMFNLSQLKPLKKVTIEFTEQDNEFALINWLNLLIAEARINQLAFCKFELKHKNNHWFGQAWGEPCSSNLEKGTEVKGATLTQLRVEKNKSWKVQCVVDV